MNSHYYYYCCCFLLLILLPIILSINEQVFQLQLMVVRSGNSYSYLFKNKDRGMQLFYERTFMISYCCRYQECLFSARKVGIIKGLLTGCGTGAMWFGNFSMFGLAIWYGTSLIGSGASGGNVVFVSIKLLLWCPHYCYRSSSGS